MTAGQSETKGGRQRGGGPDRKKLLALHFRLVAPRRANLSPKCEGGDLVGPGGWSGTGTGGTGGSYSRCLSAFCHDMMSCHNSLRGANEL